MREIRFRGKLEKITLIEFPEKDIIPAGTWIYGYYQVISNNSHVINTIEGNSFEVAPLTVGQYTGLKDISRKKIYEGDILQTSRKTLNDTIIVVNQALSGEYTITGQGVHYGLLKWKTHWEKVEIIGNIYENSELLEKINK